MTAKANAPRRIVQIATAAGETAMGYHRHYVVVLCNDGTLWSGRWHGDPDDASWVWQQLPTPALEAPESC